MFKNKSIVSSTSSNILSNIPSNYYEFGPVFKEMSFKEILFRGVERLE